MTNAPQLLLETCPHCGIARPNLSQRVNLTTTAHTGHAARNWCFYSCASCGGVTMTVCPNHQGAQHITKMWPENEPVAGELPERAREYLTQANSSKSAPVGAIMLAASSVDAMLKDKGYKTGNLYTRIDEAKNNHLITSEMAAWAHDVRLDANDQRHADEAAPLPTPDDALRAIDFATALGEFLYVLPARVKRGMKPVAVPTTTTTTGPKAPTQTPGVT